MLNIRAFHPADVDIMGLPQSAQEAEINAVDWRAMAFANAASGPAWAVVAGDEVLAIGGLQIPWPGRARAWSLISRDADIKRWPFLVLSARRMLRQARWLGIKRIEAVIRTGWAPGERLARLLDFEEETNMPYWGPDGGDYTQWVRFT
jgi:hypothetical protein